MAQDVMFAYDSSRQALILSPAPGVTIGIPVRALKAMGWKGEEGDYHRALPRFGEPLIVDASQVGLTPEQQRAMRSALNHKGRR